MDNTTRKFADAANGIVQQWQGGAKYPLVVEFCAGADQQGLSKLFAAGDYQKIPVQKALDEVLGEARSLEDQGLATRIQGARSGGKIIFKGKDATGYLGDYTLERRSTQLGEEYDYQQYRIIKPQEGGQ